MLENGLSKSQPFGFVKLAEKWFMSFCLRAFFLKTKDKSLINPLAVDQNAFSGLPLDGQSPLVVCPTKRSDGADREFEMRMLRM